MTATGDRTSTVTIERQPLEQLLDMLRIRATTELEIATEAQQPEHFEAEMLFNHDELKRLASILVYLDNVLGSDRS